MGVQDYTQRRWIILAASCIINLCIGSLYAWSVFADPMADHLASIAGTEEQNLSLVFTVANGIGPVTLISGGIINDRIGPRRLIIGGGILFGAGMIASGFATSLAMLLVTYGLGVGLGVGMVYGATIGNTVKFFPDRRGFVGGIATAAYGISSVIVPLAANALIDSYGVANAFKVLGVGMLAVICICGLFVERCPEGFAPEGWIPRASTATHIGTTDKDWREMLADPIFFIMIAMLCCGAFSGLMITSQASPIAQDMMGMGPAQAALIVSMLALLNTAGRVVSGFLSDKLGSIATIQGVFVLTATSMAMLFISSTSAEWVFYLGICGAGFCFGSIMGIYPGFTASQFGLRHNSVNYGIMFCGFAAAGLIGPSIMSVIRSSCESYAPAFLVAVALAILGLALTFLFKRKANNS